MKRFDVYHNGDTGTQRRLPYLLVLQSELLDEFPTRVVAPLVRVKDLGGSPLTLLNPSFEIEGRNMVMFTQQLAGVSKRYLTRFVCSVDPERDTILRALDFLFSGI